MRSAVRGVSREQVDVVEGRPVGCVELRFDLEAILRGLGQLARRQGLGLEPPVRARDGHGQERGDGEGQRGGSEAAQERGHGGS